LNRMNTVQDKQRQDVQHHHMYNMLWVLYVEIENKMFGIVFVVEYEIRFVVDTVENQMDDIVYVDDGNVVAVAGDDDDDDVVVVVGAAVVVAVAVVVDEMMIVAVEMDDDFVHFVLVACSFHSIVLLIDR
jgi:hypothetical protein